MQTLNSYLKGLYDGEQEKVAAISLEDQLMQMSADDLLKIATSKEATGWTSSSKRKIREIMEKARRSTKSMSAHELAAANRGEAAVAGRVGDAASGRYAREAAEGAFPKVGAAETEKLAWADGWGRQLAQIENSTMKLASLRAKIAGAHCGKTACMGEKNADLGTEGAYLKGFGRGSGVVGATAAARQYRAKTADMEAQADFTSPEAQEKAKIVQQALKATKGAPASVRKASVKVTAEKLKHASIR